MLIDLSSFESVESFASLLLADDRGTTNVVDVLFNNAGYAPREGEPVNAVGLESSFASMHLGHFYLTELLLRENPRMRVVNTSSGTHHMCAMLSLRGSRWRGGEPGCIDDAFFRNGVRSPSDGLAYIRAKLANAMHAVELPRRHPGATAIAIDLGWVGTSIQPFMRGGFLVRKLPGVVRRGMIHGSNVFFITILFSFCVSHHERPINRERSLQPPPTPHATPRRRLLSSKDTRGPGNDAHRARRRPPGPDGDTVERRDAVGRLGGRGRGEE